MHWFSIILRTKTKKNTLETLEFMLAHLRTFSLCLAKVQRKKMITFGKGTLVEFLCHGNEKNVECETVKDCIDQS